MTVFEIQIIARPTGNVRETERVHAFLRWMIR